MYGKSILSREQSYEIALCPLQRQVYRFLRYMEMIRDVCGKCEIESINYGNIMLKHKFKDGNRHSEKCRTIGI